MAFWQANMEEIFLRFPHIGEKIIDQLDNTNLTNCRLVDLFWRKSIDNQKFLWMRIIHESLSMDPNQEWQKISRKLNFEMVKILGKTANQLCKDTEEIDEIDKTPLVIAAISGNTEIVAKLFKKEVFENEDGQPFHKSAEFGMLEVCRFFIKNIDDKNPKDDDGLTPLHYAAENGHFQVCQMILEVIDDKNPKTSDDIGACTPLHIAAENNHLSTCSVIIDSGSDANSKDFNERTPLHRAAKEGHSEVFQVILSKVKEKNPRDRYGDTPLHRAAEHGQFEVCRVILEDMENSNRVFPSYVRNEEGKTPLDLATEKQDEQHEQVCDLLKLYENLSEHPKKRPRFSNSDTVFPQKLLFFEFVDCSKFK